MVDTRELSPLPVTSFYILLSLVDGPAHGYGIKHAVEERTEGEIELAAGTLYESVQRLLRQGLIHRVKRPEGVAGSVRWRFYGITEAGGDILSREVERLERDVRYARAKMPATEPHTS